jgi:PAS domain S-box-containing protein
VKKSRSETKNSLQALQASETRYRRLFETAQDGILILNAETGEIDDVNPYMIDMLHYSREEFLGKNSGRSVLSKTKSLIKPPLKSYRTRDISGTKIYLWRQKKENLLP